MLNVRCSMQAAGRRLQSSRNMATYAFAVEAKLPQKIEPTATKPVNYETKTLTNGAKVIARNAWSENVSISIAINSGSKYESAKEKGAAHLLAAAGFSGTQERSGLRLMRDIENAGFIVDATATREQIIYSIKALPDAADAAISTLSEAVFSAPVHEYIVNERKPTAALRTERALRCPYTTVSHLLYEAAYGEGSALGSSPYALDLGSLDIKEVLAFRARNFVAPNVTVIGNGISADALEKLASGISSGVAASSESSYVGGVARRRVDAGGRLHTVVAFPAASGQKVLQTALKGKVAGPAYVVPFFSRNASGGLFGVYVASSCPAETEKAISSFIAELKTVASGSGDFTGPKTQGTLENFGTLEKDSGAYMLAASKEGLSPLDFADLRNVSNDDVKAAAASIFQSRPSFAAYGDTFGLFNYDGLVKLLK